MALGVLARRKSSASDVVIMVVVKQELAVDMLNML